MKKTDLAMFLIEARTSANLTQGEVAAQLGYKTSQFISNWERALSCPPISIVTKLSKMYGVDEQNLFELMVKSSLERVEASMREDFKLTRKAK
jgi:transcriptional regulator with XRE-family HTH domain